MTELRHFRDADDDSIISTSDAERYAKQYPRDVEVQVVPLDAVVIDGPLPEVVADGNRLVAGDTSWPLDLATKHASSMHRDALEQIAIVRHLREHPPVDEEQVKAVENALWGIVLTGDATVMARRLVNAGFRVEAGDAR